MNPIRKIKENAGYVPIIRTLGCIGDSLSSGEHESLDSEGKKGYHDYYEYSWGQFIARSCGLKAFNFSKGGYQAIDFFRRDEFKDMFDKEKLCQAYIIALGANDLTTLIKKSDAYTEFGNLEEAMKADFETNNKSFVGAYVNLIKKIKEAQPKARIFVVTFPKKHAEPERAKYNKMHAEFLRKLPDYFEYLYVIDLFKYSVNYDFKKFKKKYYLGGHLSAMGYKYTADLFITYMNYIIERNLDDFRQIGFVLKDGEYNIGEKW